jgi:hypothetical protein
LGKVSELWIEFLRWDAESLGALQLDHGIRLE